MAESLKDYEKPEERRSGMTVDGHQWILCVYVIPEAKRDLLVPANIKGTRLLMQDRARGCNLPDVAYDALLGPYVRDMRAIRRINPGKAEKGKPGSGSGDEAMLRVVLEGRKLTAITG